MQTHHIPNLIQSLHHNGSIFEFLLKPNGMDVQWKPNPEKWCLLEIAGHLYDEELEDFRARLQHALSDLETPFAAIDPEGWVKTRNYLGQDYDQKVSEFLKARAQSIVWLRSLEQPDWENTGYHPELGSFSAKRLLLNWLAHDYLHIKQINHLKYLWLKQHGGVDISYAGTWR